MTAFLDAHPSRAAALPKLSVYAHPSASLESIPGKGSGQANPPEPEPRGLFLGEWLILVYAAAVTALIAASRLWPQLF